MKVLKKDLRAPYWEGGGKNIGWIDGQRPTSIFIQSRRSVNRPIANREVMMTIVRIFAIALALLSSFATASLAQTTKPLTASEIKGFLNSLDDVEKLSKKYGDTQKENERAIAEAQKSLATGGPSPELMKRAASPLTTSLPMIRESEGLDEMRATIRKHGFSSVEEWADVGDRSFRAYAATKMEAEMPEMNAKMKEARESLKKSGLPPAQQEAMLKMMGAGTELMKAYEDVPAADKVAIKPFLKQIEGLEKR